MPPTHNFFFFFSRPNQRPASPEIMDAGKRKRTGAEEHVVREEEDGPWARGHSGGLSQVGRLAAPVIVGTVAGTEGVGGPGQAVDQRAGEELRPVIAADRGQGRRPVAAAPHQHSAGQGRAGRLANPALPPQAKLGVS